MKERLLKPVLRNGLATSPQMSLFSARGYEVRLNNEICTWHQVLNLYSKNASVTKIGY